MGVGRVVVVVLGSLAALIGFALLVSGAVLGWAHATQRDDAGYYASGTHPIESAGHAVTSAHIDLGTDVREGAWVPFDNLGTVRLEAEAPDGTDLFVGIGPSAQVDGYLADVAHHQVDDITTRPFAVGYRTMPGDVTPPPPAEQGFWAASATGRDLIWDVEDGDWTVVVMNPDGSAGVRADVAVGIKTDLLAPIAIGLAVAGLLALGVAAVLLIVGLRHAATPPRTPAGSRPTEAPIAGAPVPAAPDPARAYPARLDATLDEPLSRWLWLVKVVLVIPHVVVLAFLWVAAFVLTVVAGVAILFTGRYPRPLFDFNVGVMRWTWRVGFYAFAAFGTDRYPPFRLAAEPGYPADFDVAHPERLSRGLVLVKWWLLALPHLVIVSIFSGGWSAGVDDWRVVGGGGLIGVVALIGAVVLAVRGRYPQELFHFVMGLNRWCFRVLAYVALMRDEYPPFRFDGGGTDPGTVPVVPPGPPPAPPVPPEPPLVGTGMGPPPVG
jgi:hypothetical protein